MIEVAVFVEGHTELIFMREYLLKMYDYQNVSIECFTLFTDGNFNETEYPFPNVDAGFYFQIINVGNDNAVLSRLLNREKYLWNMGFHKIIGVRDMYSKAYREAVQNGVINEDINLKFVEGAKITIQSKSVNAQNIHFCYAIMEVEAWILGLKNCFTHLDAKLNAGYIAQKLGYHLDLIDPEVTFFHPASNIGDIYNLVGKTYSKSKGDINAIMNNLQKHHFIDLAQNSKCSSFKKLHSTFFPN